MHQSDPRDESDQDKRQIAHHVITVHLPLDPPIELNTKAEQIDTDCSSSASLPGTLMLFKRV